MNQMKNSRTIQFCAVGLQSILLAICEYGSGKSIKMKLYQNAPNGLLEIHELKIGIHIFFLFEHKSSNDMHCSVRM